MEIAEIAIVASCLVGLVGGLGKWLPARPALTTEPISPRIGLHGSANDAALQERGAGSISQRPLLRENLGS